MVHRGRFKRAVLIIFCVLFVSLKCVVAYNFWPNGVVPYIMDTKSYDSYSRNMIDQTFKMIEKEICLLFPPAPKNMKISMESPALYVTNSMQKINCTSQRFDFTGPIVRLIIGYKCFSNKKAIAGNIIHMLKTSIPDKKPCDKEAIKLIQKFNGTNGLVAAADRCVISHHYFTECMERPENENALFIVNNTVHRAQEPKYSQQNYEFYDGSLWPLAAVYYEIQAKMRYTPYHETLVRNMAIIEKDSCVKFYDVQNVMSTPKDTLPLNGVLFFGERGTDFPHLGFMDGNQTINLTSIAEERPGYASHTLNLLMRILGVSMMSNRFDRDSYVFVNYEVLDREKEIYLKKDAIGSWFQSVPYDFKSVTHAPYNYMCCTCHLAMCSVDPLQDEKWEYVTTIGQATRLSQSDKLNLDLLYSAECDRRVS